MKNIFDVQQLSQFEFGAILITVLAAGLVFGCLLAYALLKRKHGPEAEAAAAIKDEFEEYKDKVDDHFNKTSEMFKDVTTQYKKLYDHMAVGAIELSKADTITMPRLEMQDSDDELISDAPEQETAETRDEVREETAADSRSETPADQAEEKEAVAKPAQDAAADETESPQASRETPDQQSNKDPGGKPGQM